MTQIKISKSKLIKYLEQNPEEYISVWGLGQSSFLKTDLIEQIKGCDKTHFYQANYSHPDIRDISIDVNPIMNYGLSFITPFTKEPQFEIYDRMNQEIPMYFEV